MRQEDPGHKANLSYTPRPHRTRGPAITAQWWGTSMYATKASIPSTSTVRARGRGYAKSLGWPSPRNPGPWGRLKPLLTRYPPLHGPQDCGAARAAHSMWKSVALEPKLSFHSLLFLRQVQLHQNQQLKWKITLTTKVTDICADRRPSQEQISPQRWTTPPKQVLYPTPSICWNRKP